MAKAARAKGVGKRVAAPLADDCAHEPHERAALPAPADPELAVGFYEASPDAVARGRFENGVNFEQYVRCVKSGVWPGYPTTAQPLQLPRWANG